MIKQNSIRITIYTVFLFCLMMIQAACKKDTKIPAYVHIDQFTLNTDFSLQGSNSHRTPDAWVTVDGQFQGVYELPATFPVLGEGNHTVRVEAGILLNGIGATRAIYPFYSAYEVNTELVKEKETSITPTISYTDNAFIVWKESFETAAYSLEKTGNSDPTINLQRATGDDAFEGNASLFVNMNSTQAVFECASVDEFALPKNGPDIYLELNYKTNVELSVGLITNAFSGQYYEGVEVLNPSTEWKKIYILMTNKANLHADARGHKIFFGTGNLSGISNPQIYIDNIKLIY